MHDLVEAIGVSESTIRRDLETLDRDGTLKRTRGGAMMPPAVAARPAMGEVASSRPRKQPSQKRAIGRAAADLLGPSETVLLDGGSTTLEVARQLAGRPLQVVTNSLPVVNLLFGQPEVEVVMLGGLLYPKTGVALGALTDVALQQLRVQTLLLGCGGIREEGLYNQNSLLVDAERRMLDAADRRILVADSTKFGQAELVRLCGLDRIDCLVTDDGVTDAWRARLEDAGITVVIAGNESAEPQDRPPDRERTPKRDDP